MRFDSPRICVQVKSGRQVSGVNVLRELQGVMQTFKADHGLLVSWGGFARLAEQEARATWATWDPKVLRARQVPQALTAQTPAQPWVSSALS